jgi:hypothetical protein
VIVDSDVSVLDNSTSMKEGVSWSYKKCDGYAPIFSCIGKSGYMINNELGEGSAHSNCEGTVDHFAETITLAKAVSPHPLLMELDSGNDARMVFQELLFTDVYCVIKRNLRKESAHQWLICAKEHAESVREGRDGSQVYYAIEERNLSFDDVVASVQIVVAARERLHDEHGQMLLKPDVTVETYWTNLPAEATEVEYVYHQHGISEQYHAELKSDLGVERLPSGKFYANTFASDREVMGETWSSLALAYSSAQRDVSCRRGCLPRRSIDSACL